ncbi:MAG: protease modulator HflC, partial [Spirochaetota bacterium]
MKKLVAILVVLAILLIVFIILGPFYVLYEGEQAVVIRFGKIVSVTDTAGLKFKSPMVDNVIKYSKKILSWDGDAQRIPTKENQFIWVDVTARWKINDPKKFYESVTTLDQGYARLDDVIDSSVRTIVSRNLLREAVRNSNIINTIERKDTFEQQGEQAQAMEDLANMTRTLVVYETVEKGRRSLSDEMLEIAGKITPQYGIDLIDIIIRQIRYSDDLTESVYNRMIKERNQIAQAFRSYGEGKKAEWLGKLDNERRSILSQAYET